MPRRSLLLTATLLGAMCLPASLTLAQQADNGGGNNNGNNSSNNDRGNRGGDQAGRGDRGNNNNNTGGPGGPGGRWDPAQMRQRMEDMMKQQLGTSDDEWKVIQPKLQKVLEVQRDARGGGFGGMFGRNRGGDRGPGGDTQATSPVQQAQRDLRTALDNKDTPAEQIQAKLTALREAREKAKADLTAAQKDLREVLTQRQEAVLVMMGMLD